MKKIMPFGGYEGVEIKDVPLEYLRWLQTKSTETYDMCENEIARREQREAVNFVDLEFAHFHSRG
jgi:hypothetical protein